MARCCYSSKIGVLSTLWGFLVLRVSYLICFFLNVSGCFLPIFNKTTRGVMLNMGVFGDTAGGYVEPLEKAYNEFSMWRRSMKIGCSQKRFSAKSLVRETTYGWFLNCKGYNARVVSEWLMYKLIEVNQQPEFQGLDPRQELSETALRFGGIVIYIGRDKDWIVSLLFADPWKCACLIRSFAVFAGRKSYKATLANHASKEFSMNKIKCKQASSMFLHSR